MSNVLYWGVIMKKKLSIIIIVLFIIQVVSINAVEYEKSDDSQETYIDSNLYLTKNHMTLLEKAIGCYDKDIDKLLMKIILLIEEKGSVNNKEFGEIIDTLNLDIISVYFSHIVFCTDFNENNFHFLPGKMFINNQGNYFGPALFLTVKDTNHFYVWRIAGLLNISFNPSYEDVDVVGIGYIGQISDHGNPFVEYRWNFLGLGLLWIVI